MGDWKQQIEAQIAYYDRIGWEDHRDQTQALLDVAVAADLASAKIEGGIPEIDAALDKLREVSE